MLASNFFLSNLGKGNAFYFFSQDDNVEMYQCKETTKENPQQIYDGNNNEDHSSLKVNLKLTNRQEP